MAQQISLRLLVLSPKAVKHKLSLINYRELLLSFEPLLGKYLGPNLIKLLGCIKALLKNNITEYWSNKKDYTICINQRKREITYILKKRKIGYTLYLIKNNGTKKKRVPWKRLILTALKAVREKLNKYYTQTYNSYSDLFTIITILYPQKKLRFFTTQE
ncbi:hypothetical protein N7481_007316 [Penicillium waksmanii]|uniref:uncharacterized protein n=1 Tax=Penicillium waksmanii TaxID=69791 RepID=UPI002549518F|nr:uncharacterized protein N7481_007316 [Penicillium waksmanii]KAJ5980018.1 hypothetical protein N7481_007316 [Penicillium waksmanii]